MRGGRTGRISAALLLISLQTVQSDTSLADDATPAAPMHSEWTFSLTTYAWTPWISGDLTIKGRSFDVDVTAGQVLDALDWSSMPAWFSYAEARNGRVALFNDIAYAKLAGSKRFAKTGPLGVATLSGNVEADYEQAIVEVGAAYEIWSGSSLGMGTAAFDVLAGGRYWNQDATVAADLALDAAGIQFPGRTIVRSGSVNWVDPFIGAKLRQNLSPGQNVSLRGDVGGFDVGSDFSWQVIATYDFQLSVTDRYAINGYLGYRALSVDYSEGSGANRYGYDAVQHGPVMGATVRF